MEIYSIGFTQTTAEHFFGRLKAAGIKRLLDVRLNNSSQLAGFAKARDLPYFLAELVECEDLWCETANFRELGRLEDEEYLELLEAVSVPDLATAFGPELQHHGRSYAIEAGQGNRSLACVRASAEERLALNHGPRLRDRDGALVPITDLRLFEADQKTPRVELVAEINRRLKSGIPAYLMLGLARAWKKPGDDRSRHWLQVNGICLADRPCDVSP